MEREVPAVPVQSDVQAKSAAPSARLASLAVRLVVSLAIGGCLVWLLNKGGLPVVPSQASFQTLPLWVWPSFVGLWLASLWLRIYRWLHLLRPIAPDISKQRTIGVGMVGFAALFAPMRMGELARPVLISRGRQVGFMQAAGTVVAERIVDGVTLSVVLALGLWIAPPLEPLPDHVGDLQLPLHLVPAIAMTALTGFVSAFAAMVLFYFWRATARRLVMSMVGIVSKPLATWLTAQVERVSDSLSFLLSRTHGLAFVRDTLIYWALNVGSTWVLLRGAGVPASAAQAAVTIGVLGLSTALPGPPGFYGMYQLGVYCGVALYFPALVQTSGVLFAFVSYCVQLITAALSLLLGLWLLARTPVPSDAT